METDNQNTTNAQEAERIGDATYDPADNKLRIRAFARLAPEVYARLRTEGFIWAPKQELFVAPAWSPSRENLCYELCGEIGDEDTTLVDRAEVRADRFDEYRDKRKADAEQARQAVAAIADNIPLGQPIICGHHSEKHARRDAERIRSGMTKAVKMWQTANYWRSRAQGAIGHARYKELPAVRSRRIKGLEADERKFQKQIDAYESNLKWWRKINDTKSLTKNGQEISFKERAQYVADRSHVSQCFPLATYPRQPPASQYEGSKSLSSALEDGIITPEQAQAIALSHYERGAIHSMRWLEHTQNRLEYERAMLDEGGGLVADKFNIEIGGRVNDGRHNKWHVVTRVNRKDGKIGSVSVIGHWKGTLEIERITGYEPPAEGDADKVKAATKMGPIVNVRSEGCLEMTKGEFDRAQRAQSARAWRIKATEQHGAYRKREVMRGARMLPVFLTDQKQVEIPPPDKAPAELPSTLPRLDTEEIRAETERLHQRNQQRAEREIEDAPFQAIKDSLHSGVQVAVVPQLFATPAGLAPGIVERADVAGKLVLEPSAGMGALVLECLRQGARLVHCFDDAPACTQALRRIGREEITVWEKDFLEALPVAPSTSPPYERIVMNPPFADGADAEHVTHAFEQWLAPGGRLVAIVSAGVTFRQDKKTSTFRAIIEEHGTIEELPQDSFKASGTGVRTCVVVLDKPE